MEIHKHIDMRTTSVMDSGWKGVLYTYVYIIYI